MPVNGQDKPTTTPDWSVKDTIWYKTDLGRRLKPEIREVYAKWSNLEGDELIRHLHTMRDRAWEKNKWPCIGQGIFLQRGIDRFPVVSSVIDRLTHDSSACLLDIGTGLGQDLRYLASRGCPTDQMWAVDLSDDMWEIGYDLFRDRSRFMAHFRQGNFLHDFDATIEQDWKGKFDFINANQFFHLFSWDEQVKAMSQAVQLSKPGTILIGFQRAQAGEAVEVKRDWGSCYFHNTSSYDAIWRQVQASTSTAWNIEFEITDCRNWGLEPEDVDWMPPGAGYGSFTCTRLA